MKRVWKKMMKGFIALSFIISMVIPTANVDASEKIKTSQNIFQMVKEKKNAKARNIEPEEWNQTEIKAYRFSSVSDVMKYMLTGGIKYYNRNFFKKSNKVKITAVENGVLFLDGEEEKGGKLSIYDNNMKFVQNLGDEGFIKVNVKAGDSYYVEFPSDAKEVILMTYVLKDNFQILKSNEYLVQKGEGKATYHTFTLKKRSYALIEAEPLVNEGGSVTSHLEKKVKGQWKRIGKKYNVTPGDEEICTYGLRPGAYRLVLKAKTNQACTVRYMKSTVKKNVSYRKSKAQNIKAGKEKENIYTTGEKASRWYKMTVKSTKKQRKIKLYGESDNGKFKFRIYRKGKKKPMKTKTLSNENIYTYKLPKKKETYYVKVSKIGKRTNGYYSVEFR